MILVYTDTRLRCRASSSVPSSTTSGRSLHVGHEIRLLGREAVDGDALDPLDDDAQGAVRRLDHLLDAGQHSDVVDVTGHGVLDVGGLGGHQPHLLVSAQDLVDELHRTWLAHSQGHQGIGEDHRVFEGQDGQVRLRGGFVVAALERALRDDHEVLAGRYPAVLRSRSCSADTGSGCVFLAVIAAAPLLCRAARLHRGVSTRRSC